MAFLLHIFVVNVLVSFKIQLRFIISNYKNQNETVGLVLFKPPKKLSTM